jgi:hypothetical protein
VELEALKAADRKISLSPLIRNTDWCSGRPAGIKKRVLPTASLLFSPEDGGDTFLRNVD